MSMVHLKTRRMQIEANKKAKEDIKIKWNINGKEVEVIQPKEAPGCFETTKHAGIYYDGKEQLAPGRLGRRVGFIREEHHFQIMHWMFNFSHAGQTRKTGKFILLVDGWEAESGIPVNKFFRWMYTRVFLSGFGTLALSGVGIASVTVSDNQIVNGWISRIFLVFIPIALYYVYAGFVGMVKFHLRMKLDESGPPWWPLDEVFNPEDSEESPAQDGHDNTNDGDVDTMDEQLISSQPELRTESVGTNNNNPRNPSSLRTVEGPLISLA